MFVQLKILSVWKTKKTNNKSQSRSFVLRTSALLKLSVASCCRLLKRSPLFSSFMKNTIIFFFIFFFEFLLFSQSTASCTTDSCSFSGKVDVPWYLWDFNVTGAYGPYASRTAPLFIEGYATIGLKTTLKLFLKVSFV